MNSEKILKLVFERFSNFKGFAETKTGSTHMSKVYKFDFWGVESTWTRFRTVGVEIKVSRADFLQDNKWPAYLYKCHEFYFACPKGIIMPEELPEGVGLFYVLPSESKLVVKRKAAYRTEGVDVTDVLRYILMWRKHNPFIDGIARDVVHKKLSERESYFERVQSENSRLIMENNKLQQLKEFCEINNIDLAKTYSPASNLKRIVTQNEQMLSVLQNQLESAVRTINELRSLK